MRNNDQIPVTIEEVKHYVEKELNLRPLIDSIEDDRENAIIEASSVFRMVIYSLCSGDDSINLIDGRSHDCKISGICGTDTISARTIGRSYAGIQVEQLQIILRAEAKAQIEAICDTSCEGICIFDMSKHCNIMGVVAKYVCIKHDIQINLDFEPLNAKETKIEEENIDKKKKRNNKGMEGEATAVKRIYPRVIEHFGEYIKIFTCDGYYTYWFMDMVEKDGKYFAIKSHEDESLLVLEEAKFHIRELYNNAPVSERLKPIKWIDDDKYKEYEAYDVENVPYYKSTKKKANDKVYRVIKVQEERLKQNSKGIMYIITNIPQAIKNAKEIRHVVRKEWSIENGTFRTLNQNNKSKISFFRKNKNAQEAMFCTLLIFQNAIIGYMHKKKTIYPWLSKYKNFSIKRIQRILAKTWLQRRSSTRKLRKEGVRYLMRPKPKTSTLSNIQVRGP